MQVSDLHELDQIRRVEQKKALHTVCTFEWMWNFYSERTADGREDRRRTSSEQCRKSRTMSRVVIVVFRGRQYQKPQTDRAASVLRSHGYHGY